jgi:serine/threonine protein phosphatase PrpC
MNGWRNDMEDAHLIFIQDTWGFFGVFDGHGGQACSRFAAKRLREALERDGCPKDDAAAKDLILRVDQEFLDAEQASGSTATMCIVHRPIAEGKKHRLRVINAGDSRVLLGRRDGSIVDGGGTDKGLTTDHKPDHPAEQERIYRCGGTVEKSDGGVARVNCDHDVSRGFGDYEHKKTGGPAQAEHPVSAEPELTTLECSASDFLLLVCDGISEGTFPNREVVSLAADKLRQSPSMNPGAAATAVCREALRQGSKDNLSCMIVLFGGVEEEHKETELIPGPYQFDHIGFQQAYASMIEHAGGTLPEALEMRYDLVKKKVKMLEAGGTVAEDVEGENLATLQAELGDFGDGPTDNLAPRSPERTAWFANLLADRSSRESNDDAENQFLGRPPAQMQGSAEGTGQLSEDLRREVQVASLDELRAAVEEHPKLKWDERLVDVCNQLGEVLQDDETDGTSQVTFKHKRLTAWLPTRMLTHIRALVLVAPVEELRPAIEAHSALKWDARLEAVCQQEGEVLRVDDADGTSRVRFPPPLSLTAWLPTGCLCPAGKRSEVRVAPLEELRQAVDAHKDVEWDPVMTSLGGSTGVVTETEDAKGLSQVKFALPEGGFSHWTLPSSALTEVNSSGATAADDTESKRQRTG